MQNFLSINLERLLTDENAVLWIVAFVTAVIGPNIGIYIKQHFETKRRHEEEDDLRAQRKASDEVHFKKIATQLEYLGEKIARIEESADLVHQDLKQEILRNTMLSGIKTHDFSSSELWYFFEKYKASGGNGLVEEKVMAELDYLKEIGK
jgi:hypothetical protein